MSEKDILDILENWSEEFNVSNFALNFFRNAIFAIAKGIAILAADLEDAAKSLYNLLPTIIEDSRIGELISDFKPLLVVLLSLSIMATGYIIMFKKDGKSNLLQNIMILFLVFSIMPVTAGKVAELTAGASQSIFGVMEGESAAAYDIIDNNVIDLYMLMEEDLVTKSSDKREQVLKGSLNAFSPNRKSISLVKISSELDYDEEDFGDYQKLTKRQIDIDATGEPYLKKLDGGVFNFAHSYYYRYSVNWTPLLVSLLAMFVTLMLTCIRLAKMIWEVVLNMIFAPFVAVMDMASGQRTKELIRNLLSIFAIMGLISVIIGAYNLGLKLISHLHQTGSIGTILFLVCLVGLAIITIEGPSILQRIYGIDAGGRGPLGMLQSVYYGARLGKDVAKVPAKVALTAAHLGKKGYEKGRSVLQKKSGNENSTQHTPLDSGRHEEPETKNMDRNVHAKEKERDVAERNRGDKNLRTTPKESAREAAKENRHGLTAKSPALSASANKTIAKGNAQINNLKGTAAKDKLSERTGGNKNLRSVPKETPKEGKSGLTANATKLSDNRTKRGNSQDGTLRKSSLGGSSLSEGNRMMTKSSAREGEKTSSSQRPQLKAADAKTQELAHSTYQTTDNRIIKSLREKNAEQSAKTQTEKMKKFGQRRGLK